MLTTTNSCRHEVVVGIEYAIWNTEFRLEPTLELYASDQEHLGPNVCLLDQDQENTYEIILYRGFPGIYRPFLPSPDVHGIRQAKFERHNRRDLPSRILLETHAAIARIFNVSRLD